MRLFRFLVTGVSASAVEFVIFLLLQQVFGRELLVVAQSVSFLAGFVVSFTLNRRWVFKSTGPILNELSKYMVLLGINLVITNLLISLMVNGMNVEDWIAKIIVMVMVAAWNYLIFQKIVFRTKN